MALELASFPADLISANPTGGDPISQGFQQINLLKGVVGGTFPNLTGQVKATQLDLNNPLLSTNRPVTGFSIPYYNSPNTASTIKVTEFGLSLLSTESAEKLGGAVGVGGYVSKAGDTMTGALTVPEIKIAGSGIVINAGGIQLGPNMALAFDATRGVLNIAISGKVVATLKATGEFRAIGNVGAGGL